jgi:NADH dehydrogenase [ubiquinone] 1 alpha subcomplex assembly factor 7
VTALAEILRRRIAAEGPITIADFMTAALLHPEHGYYTGKDPFGADGDFITAPEISQMFGELIGLWCAATWQQMGMPRGITLIELGPGRGTLMADALRALRMAPEFLEHATIHLVEASPALRAVQKSTLSAYDVTWHDGLESLPEGPCLLIANEFLDALPIRQIVRQDDIWHERLVGHDGDGFVFILDKAPSPLATLLPPPIAENTAPRSLIEMAPAVLGVAKTVSDRIARDGGAALFVDYGHGETSPGETLQAVRAHQPVDVLDAPGTADVTAHIDFAAFARAASNASVHGPIEQGDFLMRLGIEARRATLSQGATQQTKTEIDQAFRRLTAPEEMGRLFKVMALVPKDAPVPAGFETED